MKDYRTIRIVIGLLCAAGLAVVFVFQGTDAAGLFGSGHRAIDKFIINRLIRFFLNDIFVIGLIYALFQERKYVVFSLWVQLAGVVFVLIPYIIVKLHFPEYNGPLINYVHRLIMNPVLLLLLIPAFYYQKQIRNEV